jgi:hypothetical protein
MRTSSPTRKANDFIWHKISRLKYYCSGEAAGSRMSGDVRLLCTQNEKFYRPCKWQQPAYRGI